MSAIYLDNNATTPTDPMVVEAMAPYWTECFGNPSSSTHVYGWQAQSVVDKARRSVAKLIAAKKQDIVFTSGATESNNTVLFAVARSALVHGDHIVTSNIEHKCVLNASNALQKQGIKVTYVAANGDGLVSPDDIAAAITSRTRLVSVMAANNEIGTLQPIADIGRLAKQSGVLFHTDAAQMLGKLPIDVDAHNIDFLSASSHKLYGPMGVGAIYARNTGLLACVPLIHGGGQEFGVRSGTLNVPGIVGFAKACDLARNKMQDEAVETARMKDNFVHRLLNAIPDMRINGHRTQSLPGCVSLCVPGLDVMQLLSATKDELAISTGSACASADQEPSHVLRALGLTRQHAAGSFRIGIGLFTTTAQLDRAGTILIAAISALPRTHSEVAA